jgi:hypothetical protein
MSQDFREFDGSLEARPLPLYFGVSKNKLEAPDGDPGTR